MKTSEIMNLHRALKHISSEELNVEVTLSHLGARLYVATKRGQSRQRTIPIEQLRRFDNAGRMLAEQATEMVNELQQPAGY